MERRDDDWDLLSHVVSRTAYQDPYDGDEFGHDDWDFSESGSDSRTKGWKWIWDGSRNRGAVAPHDDDTSRVYHSDIAQHHGLDPNSDTGVMDQAGKIYPLSFDPDHAKDIHQMLREHHPKASFGKGTDLNMKWASKLAEFLKELR